MNTLIWLVRACVRSVYAFVAFVFFLSFNSVCYVFGRSAFVFLKIAGSFTRNRSLLSVKFLLWWGLFHVCYHLSCFIPFEFDVAKNDFASRGKTHEISCNSWVFFLLASHCIAEIHSGFLGFHNFLKGVREPLVEYWWIYIRKMSHHCRNHWLFFRFFCVGKHLLALKRKIIRVGNLWLCGLVIRHWIIYY